MAESKKSTPSEPAGWLDDMGRHHLMSESNRPYLEAAAEVRRLEANENRWKDEWKEIVVDLEARIAELTSERNNRQSDNDALRTQIVNERNELETRIAELEAAGRNALSSWGIDESYAGDTEIQAMHKLDCVINKEPTDD